MATLPGQGTEVTSAAVDHWAYWNHVMLDFSRSGKPVDKTVCEAFNGSLSGLQQSPAHSNFGHLTPHAFRSAGAYLPRHVAAEN